MLAAERPGEEDVLKRRLGELCLAAAELPVLDFTDGHAGKAAVGKKAIIDIDIKIIL